jgi:hypothetical protein
LAETSTVAAGSVASMLPGSAAVAVPFRDDAAGIADPSRPEILRSLEPEYRDSPWGEKRGPSGAEYGLSPENEAGGSPGAG